MKRDELTRLVKLELEHIPKGDKIGSPQNVLRRYYNARRRHDVIKTDKTKEETLQDCIQILKVSRPDFVPKYDEDFFKMRKKDLLQRLLGRMIG